MVFVYIKTRVWRHHMKTMNCVRVANEWEKCWRMLLLLFLFFSASPFSVCMCLREIEKEIKDRICVQWIGRRNLTKSNGSINAIRTTLLNDVRNMQNKIEKNRRFFHKGMERTRIDTDTANLFMNILRNNVLSQQKRIKFHRAAFISAGFFRVHSLSLSL